MCVHDEKLRPLGAVGHPTAPDPVDRSRAVSRAALHQALRTGLDNVAHWGTRCTGYELHGGGVRARLADGSHADGGVLIGADDANFLVRAAYCARRAADPERLDDLDGTAARAVVAERTAGAVPTLAVIAATGPATIGPMVLRTLPRLGRSRCWATPRTP